MNYGLPFLCITRSCKARSYSAINLWKVWHTNECWGYGSVCFPCRPRSVLACGVFCLLQWWWVTCRSCLLLGLWWKKVILSTTLEWVSEAAVCWMWRSMFPNLIIQRVNNCCDGYDSDDYGITLVLCIVLRYAKELKKIDGKNGHTCNTIQNQLYRVKTIEWAM